MEAILDKVRKLLALANDAEASEGEIENALKMAEKLMIKHNIDRGEIEMSPLDIAITIIPNEHFHEESVFWLWDLLQIIGDGYNCKVYKSGYIHNYFYKIVGFNEDREVVFNLYNKILPMIRALYVVRYQEYLKSTKGAKLNKGKFVRSYIAGFLNGLKDKLQANRKEVLSLEADNKAMYQLMVVKKDTLLVEFIKEELNLKVVKVKKADIDPLTYYKGVQDGKEESYQDKLHS